MADVSTPLIQQVGGSVGIGTGAPSQKLEVSGNIKFTNGGYIYGDGSSSYVWLSNAQGSYLRYGSVGVTALAASLQLAATSEEVRITNNNGKIWLDGSGNVGIGTDTPTSKLHFGPANFSRASWLTTGALSQFAAVTVTNSSTAASGTAASAVFHSFAQPTLAATNASVTTTDAATVYIADAPANGTNNTSTNRWSLWVDAGDTRLDGNLTLGGNLTVNGTTTTVNSTITTVDDPIFTLGGDTAPASDDNKDRGIEFRWHNGTVAKVGFFGFDDSTGYLTFIPDATNSSEVFSGTVGTIQVGATITDKIYLGSPTYTGSSFANIITANSAIEVQVDNTTTVSQYMDANDTNNVIALRAPFGQNPSTTSNSNAKWGILFAGGPPQDYTNYPFTSTQARTTAISKAAAIYGLSEDSLGYNRQVGLAFYTSSMDANMAERVRIDNNGNVGIGTISPNSKLEVQGKIAINNGVNNALYIDTTVADGTTRDAIYLFENDGQASGRQAIVWYNGDQNYYKARLWTQVGGSFLNTQFGIDVADNARTIATRLYFSNGDAYFSGSITVTGTSNTIGGTTIPASSTLLTTSNYSSTTDSRYPRVYRGTVNVSNAGYTCGFTVSGDALASAIRFTAQGTANSVVVNSIIDLAVNHYQDIVVTSKSGIYTLLTIRVVSNNDDAYAVLFTTNGAYAATLNLEVFPLNSETVTFTGTNPFSGTTLTHQCDPGTVTSATGGNSGDLKVGGNLTASGTGAIGGNLTVSGGTTTLGASGVGNGSLVLKRSSDGLTVGDLTVDTTNSLLKLNTAYSYLTFGTEGIERARFSAGNLALGTTTSYAKLTTSASISAPSSPNYFDGLALYNQSDGGARIIAVNSLTNATNPLAAIEMGVLSSGAGTDDGVIRFSTATNAVSAVRAVISNNGNVGVGETNPLFKLQVAGTSNFGDGPFVVSGGTNSNSYYDQNTGAYFHNPGAMVRKDSSNTDVGQSPATFVLYNNDGTNSTSSKLVFANRETATSSANPIATAAIVSQKTAGVNGGWGDGNLRFLIKVGANYIEPLTIRDTSGNVGIGTVSPANKLDVTGATRTNTHSSNQALYVTGEMSSGSTGTSNGNIEFRHSNASQGIGFGHNTIYQTGFNTNQELNLLSRGNSPITLNAYAYSTGNVGIGELNPNAKLQIAGTSTGILTVGTLTNNWGGVVAIGTTNGNGVILSKVNTSNDTNRVLVLMRDDTNGATIIGYTGGGTSTDIGFNIRAAASSYFNGGNVGIGTTTPNNILHVKTAGGTISSGNAINATNMHGIRIENSLNDNTSVGIWFGTNNAHWTGISGQRTNSASTWGTHLSFYTHEDVTNDLAYSRERMRITSEGSVGIGTTGPNTKLEVYDSTNAVTAIRINNPNTGAAAHSSIQFANANSTNGAGVVLFGSGYTSTALYRQDGMYIYTNRNGGITLNVETNNPLYFGTNNTERMRINGNGNIGIGTSSSAPGPLDVFDIAGTTAGAPGRIVFGDGGGYTPYMKFYKWTGSSNYYYQTTIGNSLSAGGSLEFWTGTGGGYTVGNDTQTLRMIILANTGNVGIGTTSPESPLHVAKTGTDEQLILGNTATNRDISMAMYSGTTKAEILRFQSSYRLLLGSGSAITQQSFFTGGTERLTIISSGNVGIGTGGTANYKLEVNGSFAATTKSFVINHPTKAGKKLRYGSLEGPENGVYVRGKLKGGDTIELPEYWTKLIHPDSITVNLTPIGKHQKLYVKEIADNKVIVANDGFFGGEIHCFYTVFGERADVEKLQTEVDA